MNRWQRRMRNLHNNQVLAAVVGQANQHPELDVNLSNDIALY